MYDIRFPVSNCFYNFYIVPHLESQISVLMHAKDLRTVYDWKTLDIVLKFLQFVRIWCIVDTLKQREFHCC